MLVSQTSSRLRFVSSTFLIFQILVHSHFALVNSLLALDAPEPVSQPVIQMAINMITIHLVWVRQKPKEYQNYILFHHSEKIYTLVVVQKLRLQEKGGSTVEYFCYPIENKVF